MERKNCRWNLNLKLRYANFPARGDHNLTRPKKQPSHWDLNNLIASYHQIKNNKEFVRSVQDLECDLKET